MDILDISPAGIVFRDVDGTVVLDTADRMPAVVGSVSFSGSVLLPKITDERRVSRDNFPFGDQFRWLTPEHDGRQTVDMGAWSGPAFNFFFGRILVGGTRQGFGGGTYDWRLPGIPFIWSGGSLLIHGIYSGTINNPTYWYWRYMIPEVEAGRLVMAFYRVNRDNVPGWQDTELNTTIGSSIDFYFEFDATFCIVDL